MLLSTEPTSQLLIQEKQPPNFSSGMSVPVDFTAKANIAESITWENILHRRIAKRLFDCTCNRNKFEVKTTLNRIEALVVAVLDQVPVRARQEQSAPAS